MKMSELYNSWVETHVAPARLSRWTMQKYEYYGKSIIKFFDDIEVEDYTREAYQIRLNKLGDTVGKDWLYRVNSFIRQSLAYQNLPDVTKGARLNAQKSAQKEEEKYIKSVAQYEKLLKELLKREDYERTPDTFLLYFLLRTGLRFAEAIALTWEDVDFEKKIIYTYRRYSVHDSRFVAPKTPYSVRFVPLGTDVVNLLRRLQTAQNQAKIEHDFIDDENFLFSYFRWEGFPRSFVISRYFKRIQRDLGFSPVISVKGTRHTFASVMLDRNVKRDVLAQILGHKDTSMLRTYGHILDEKLKSEFSVYQNFNN